MTALLSENLRRLREEIAETAETSGRDAGEVALIAVTKTVGPETVSELVRLGMLDIGENRVGEMEKKHRIVGGDVRWHLIGHLQRNKVKRAVAVANLIHSVDNPRLIAEIGHQAAALGKVQEALLQVSYLGEDRFGFTPEEAPAAMEECLETEGIEPVGLMTMAAFGAPERAIRSTFASLRALRDALGARFPEATRFRHLSMGMSEDYRIAIEEGATMLRIGTALLKGV